MTQKIQGPFVHIVGYPRQLNHFPADGVIQLLNNWGQAYQT